VQTLTLALAWLLYTQTELAGLAKKTQEEYRCAFRRIVHELPARPTAAEVAAWHRGSIGNGRSVRYANFNLAVLRTVCSRAGEQAGDHELGAAIRRVRPVREQVLLPRCPPDDLLPRVLPAARNPAERAILELAGLAGLRRGELLGLRPTDWSPDTMTLAVERQRVSPTRKNRRPHVCGLSTAPELVSDLNWTVEHVAELKSRTGWHRGRVDGFLFPWSLRYLELLLDRVRASLGADADRYLPDGWAWHSFRHWGATRLAKAGKTMAEVQAWLGDSSPELACRYVAMTRGVTCAPAIGPAPLGPLAIVDRKDSAFSTAPHGAELVYMEDARWKALG
jgi:integrase